MYRREFLGKSGLGLLAATPAAPQDGKSDKIDVLQATDFGAVGDGVTDDTAALQAAINAAIASGRNLYIPTGKYKTTATLIAGGKVVEGVRISGAGPSNNATGGTSIIFNGTGATAILQIDSTLWRYCSIEDLALICETPRGAAYGLLFNNTEFSQHRVSRVGVGNAPNQSVGPTTAFGISSRTGGNGEFILFEDCFGNQVDCFFYSNAPQAYVQEFHHCRATINSGGTYFHLDLGGSGAGGIEVFDFNGSSVQANGISNTTLILDGGQNSCLNFLGGRIEHLTQIFRNTGGPPSTPNITGMQIGVDFDPTNAHLTLEAAVEIDGGWDNLLIESCQFLSDTLNATFPVKWNSGANIHFKSCMFQGFNAPPYVLTTLYNDKAQLSFENCTVDSWGNHTLGQGTRLSSFDRHFDFSTITAGKRRGYSTSALAPSGRPSNLLVKPEVTVKNGSAIMPDSPWVLKGASSIAAYDWNGASPPASPSPWAKNITLSHGSSIYQDIISLPLNGTGNYFFYGANMTLIAFQGFFTLLGNAAGSIALLDSASGVIYDQYIFTAGGPQNFPQLITLSAVIQKTSTLSYPRLKISNTDSSNALRLSFNWMFVSGQPDAMFTPSDSTATELVDNWALGAENARFWSRLALPHKFDNFGSGAANPLKDLGSDIYLSATDERITFYAKGKWWKTPRTTYAASAPASGTWELGDIVYNNSPSAGGYVGWICVAAGAPGTWKTFGAISR